MNRSRSVRSATWAAVLTTACLVAGPAEADPPPWAAGGAPSQRQDDRYESRYDRNSPEYRQYSRETPGGASYRDGGPLVVFYFDDQARRTIHGYYGAQFSRGDCPPGLAKKRNGCLPPGQARKWHRGQPLPGDAVYVPLPRELLVQLPPPPLHHEYVRVAADILLIATGTALVIDAIEDIGRSR